MLTKVVFLLFISSSYINVVYGCAATSSAASPVVVTSTSTTTTTTTTVATPVTTPTITTSNGATQGDVTTTNGMTATTLTCPGDGAANTDHFIILNGDQYVQSSAGDAAITLNLALNAQNMWTYTDAATTVTPVTSAMCLNLPPLTTSNDATTVPAVRGADGIIRKTITFPPNGDATMLRLISINDGVLVADGTADETETVVLEYDPVTNMWTYSEGGVTVPVTSVTSEYF